jgi:hypothetical protein
MRLFGALVLVAIQTSALGAQDSVPRAGWFHVIWRDARTPTPMRSEYYVLIDDSGRWWDLDLDPRVVRAPGGPLAINRTRVLIDAERLPVVLGAETPRLRIRSIGTERNVAGAGVAFGDAGAAVSGSRPYVTILCAFADSPTVLPASKARMEEVMGSTYPGMDHYYREMSEGLANLAGSVVVGWYTLPQPRSYYVLSGGAALGTLSRDCTAAADADVHFPSFAGINLQFNQRLDCCSWGGSRTLTLDGVTRSYPMTWMADWAIGHSVYAHEIGHSFGWAHSHGAYGAQYDSKWDVMSNANNYRDPAFGWVAVHTIAFHKDRAGWIPSARKFVATPAGSSSILLERGAQPGTNANYLLAQVAIPGTSSFYTVEARRFTGNYDLRLPAEAVIIHRTNGFEAEVVDVDLNANPNDAAAQWLPGETFVDAGARISVAVEAQVGNAFQVKITTGFDVLALALGRGGASDSATAGSVTPLLDSVAVTISGSGAADAPWSATSRRSSTTLLSSSGTGSGVLRWQRDPSGLGEGLHVDTITVTSAGAMGSPARLVDTLRVVGPPAPLMLTMDAASRRDSVMARSTGLLRDSVMLSFTGTGASSVPWTAAGHASWLTLVNPSGAGGGMLRWTRDPSGLVAGTYVDTITVAASGAAGSPGRVVDTLRVLPLPSVDAAAAELLGAPRLTSFEKRYLDHEGNRDAVYNLGDFLAFLDRSGLDVSQELRARLLGVRRDDR